MTLVSVRPSTLDIDLYAGDGFGIQFVFVDQETGDPWPLAGTWEAQIRSSAGEVIETFAIETDAEAGKLHLGLTGEQTTALALPGHQHPSSVVRNDCLRWDLQQSEGPRTWYRGLIHSVSDVTRP